MKKGLCLLLSLILCLCLTSCDKGYLDREEIIDLVNEHLDVLKECIATGDFSRVEGKWGIQHVEDRISCIDFYCGGKGLSVSGFDYGFYYTAEDVPLTSCSWSPNSPLRPSGEGWEAEGGDHYYTERICEGFYYYEAGC